VIYRLLLIFSFLVVAGPELGLGLELLVLLDLMGIELFLFVFSVRALFYSRMLIIQVQKLDPYFFLSSRREVADCPALLAHATPFFVL